MTASPLEWIVAGFLSALVLALLALARLESRDRARTTNLCFALLFDDSFYQTKRTRFRHWIKTHPADDRTVLYLAASLELTDLAKRIRAPAVASLMWKLRIEQDVPIVEQEETSPQSQAQSIGDFRVQLPSFLDSPRSFADAPQKDDLLSPFDRREDDRDQTFYITNARRAVWILKMKTKLKKLFRRQKD